ncbi:MAG: response regulator [Deltaproteobacteria bacterium]|jgi:PAS domain S-box-containing protein|nr:response regulator [Deltaproteobacteria bacterium]MBW2532748.1 response regulator [Deltaproteobacteria bacterium]
MPTDPPAGRDAEREREIAALRETVAALKRATERSQRRHGLDQFAVQKAMANLEGTIQQRTRELRRSEQRYRALFDHSPVMALTVDERGMITDANFDATATLEQLREPLLGRHLTELFDRASRATIERLLDEGAGTEHEIPLTDGRLVDATVSMVPGHTDGQVLLRDLTQWLELQREVQHTRRLAAIGRLAAGVAHEINNPLAVLQLAIRRLEDQSAAEGDRTVSTLLNHVDRIARIVENLQSFASPRPPEPQTLQVSELTRAALELAGPSIRDLKLRVDVEPDDLACYADQRQLEQVLVNLLTNAARATDGAGTVELSARREPGCVRLRIADDGPGIAAQVLDDIFTPFVVGSATDHSGMGLGLSITWGLVRENGGTITAHNMDGGGACFEVCLPTIEPEADGEIAPPSSLGELGPPLSDPSGARSADGQGALGPIRRVLCVDDERTLLETMVLLLEADGFAAEGVSSAELALQRLDEQPFDAVISDLRLPRMSGAELAATIAERHPSLRGRVILMSGLFSEDKVPEPYLQKPFKEEELLKLLDRLGRRPAGAPPDDS